MCKKLIGPPWIPPKRCRWWQFWKRKTKVRGAGLEGQLRGKLDISRGNPDVVIVDDIEGDKG